MGVTMANFYAPLHLEIDDENSPPSEESSVASSDRPDVTPPTPGYVIPTGLTTVPVNAIWRRDALFDASRGEIALLWSIFRIMGTPTPETWPVCLFHLENFLPSLMLRSSRTSQVTKRAPSSVSATLPSSPWSHCFPICLKKRRAQGP